MTKKISLPKNHSNRDDRTISSPAAMTATMETMVRRPVSGNVIKSGQITANETWTADKVYQLSGRVVVTNGATLTIEAGTIVKAEAGQEANASTLIIARGAKLMAEGTASAPIIFTSVADNIEPGNISSPNLNSTFSGLWGGLPYWVKHLFPCREMFSPLRSKAFHHRIQTACTEATIRTITLASCATSPFATVVH